MGREMEYKADIEYYAAVQSREIDWLWYPYIPCGKITLLQGDPGDGKSTFMLHLAAAVSTGGVLPDGTELEQADTVIYQCSEDNVADTIKPRLQRAGADCDKVAYIVEESRSLTFDDQRIEDALIRTKARLVIFDPIQAYIPPESDMVSAAKMRQMTKRLSELAERYGCAIVLIGHMNKTGGGKNLYRGLGSIDLAAAARSVLMIQRDRDNPDIRYLFPVKSSLAYEGNAIRFIFDKDIGFHVLGTCTIDDDGFLGAAADETQNKSQKAERILRLILSGGSQPSGKILKEMKTVGISERTVRTVMKKLGIRAYRKANVWYWEYPSENDVDPDMVEGNAANGNESYQP